MKNNKGFTLIEMIAVVVILAVVFVYMTPKLSSLINSNDSKKIEIKEARVIGAAKEYLNDNVELYKRLYYVGDKVYINKSDLLNSSLIKEDDLTELNDFKIKCELVTNDNVDCTIEYLN